MTDCAHWLEPMLEAEKAELRKEKSEHRRDVDKAQSLINDIRALINSADAHFAGMPSALSQPGLNELLLRQQMEAIRPAEKPCQGGLIGGILGGGWPF